jgi:polysaccharide export outer membrane protein
MIVETMVVAVILAQAVSQPPGDAAPPAQSYEAAGHGGEAGEGKAAGTEGSAGVADAGYRIGPEDVLKIEVWKENDFSASAPVRADGKISVPLLNDVQAAGLTPLELAGSLREQLRKYVVDPKITVSVTQMNSRKVYVMGQVNRQGIVRLQSNLSVLQAISAAGGLAQFANGKKIYVLRSKNGQQVRLAFHYDAVIKGKHPEENILLEPGDTVVVP